MAGRPRDPVGTTAILAAAVSLLRERGYAGLTLDDVARAAGVGKSSLYTRFSGKEELAAAAVASLQRDLPPPTGELRRDLCVAVRETRGRLGSSGAEVLAALVAPADPVRAEARRRLLAPLESSMRRTLELAQARRELPEWADLAAAVSLLLGLLLSPPGDQPDASGWPDPAVDVVLRGLGWFNAAAPSRTGSGGGQSRQRS